VERGPTSVLIHTTASADGPSRGPLDLPGSRVRRRRERRPETRLDRPY
jgi:hypothetical protein